MYYRLRNLDRLQAIDLINAFRAIPNTVTKLSLSWDRISTKIGTELAEIFRAIPANVHSLHLSGNSLDDKIGAEPAEAFTAIPPTLTSLDLSMNLLGIKTGAQLAEIFRAIPANVHSFHLSGNSLDDRTGAELAEAFTAIPPTLTSLDLSMNLLGRKTGAELAQAFTAIPPTVTSLDLSMNLLGRKTGEELAQAFTAIPPTVTSLDLSMNHLGTETGAELAQAFTAIPPTVTWLYLSGNNLWSKTGAELAQAFTAIPPTVTSLYLSGNNLWSKTGAELAQAFTAIPPTVTSLYLSGNNLWSKTGAELAQAFTAIPPTVTSLDLNGNNLWSKTGEELAQAFRAIPDNVTSLDLSGNLLQRISLADLLLIQDSLPNIETLYLSHKELVSMTPEQRAQLKAVFPKLRNTVFLDDSDMEMGGTDLREKGNIARRLGFPAPFPSLYNIATHFVISKRTPILGEYAVPIEVMDDLLAQGYKRACIQSAFDDNTRRIIAHLTSETTTYLSHLEKAAKEISPEFKLSNHRSAERHSPDLQAVLDKYEIVQSLLERLISNDLDAFRKNLSQANIETLKKHRTPDWMLFVKNCFCIIGIIATGIVPYLTYTFFANKPVLGFTQSHGEEYMNRINQIVNAERI